MHLMIAAALALASSAITTGQPGDCREAMGRYRVAQADARLAADRYGRCVTRAQGDDDCSSEYRLVREAQEAFEEATADLEALCRR